MAELLPTAAWRGRDDLAALVAALGPGQARYVGGAVRDTLLGEPVSDIDIATPLVPAQVTARLDAAGIRSVPTGIEHGTVTAVLAGGPVEITTLRSDIATDGRRALVAFGSDWRADAERRDFTINALYADPVSGELFDYFGGVEDLAAGRVRFIGDAVTRIREDHLRILRYFRFKARFGSQVTDKKAETACAEMASSLKGLSRERIGMEMTKLLALPDPAPTVTRMAELGVLKVILPEGDSAPLARLVAEEARQGVAPHPLRRLAALLPPDPSLAEKIAARFRLSNSQRKRLMSAAARDQILPGTGRWRAEGVTEGPEAHRLHRVGDQARSPSVSRSAPATSPFRGGSSGARALAYRIGREEALDRLLLTGESVAPLIGWTAPTFPLKGGEIVARGLAAGPEVARILRRIEDRWVDEGFPNRERVALLLAEELPH
ncbi:MAG: CCA tRNA nucleotidyltransferase [Novosphingobium sp.]